MRLSESLRKNIMEVSVGRVLNKFKVRSRRSVLFPEDILANYVKECESKGHGKEVRKICRKYGILGSYLLMPSALRKLPLMLFLNRVLKILWTNIGVLDDLHATKREDIIIIETKNELISRIIGKNEFCTGFIEGVVSALSDHKAECIENIQTFKSCKYVIRVRGKTRLSIDAKNKEFYNKLNTFSPTRGFELKGAIKGGFFTIIKNRVYFRGKPLVSTEPTFFHLIANNKIPTERVAHISYDLFKDIIMKDASSEVKLTLLKNFLQTTGWGLVSTAIDDDKIVVSIRNPPYGLQSKKDNFDFLARFVLGFLWTIDKYSISDVKLSYRFLKLVYCL